MRSKSGKSARMQEKNKRFGIPNLFYFTPYKDFEY